VDVSNPNELLTVATASGLDELVQRGTFEAHSLPLHLVLGTHSAVNFFGLHVPAANSDDRVSNSGARQICTDFCGTGRSSAGFIDGRSRSQFPTLTPAQPSPFLRNPTPSRERLGTEREPCPVLDLAWFRPQKGPRDCRPVAARWSAEDSRVRVRMCVRTSLATH
jgi:hypothetical protein